MQIHISVSDGSSFTVEAPDGSDVECIALHRSIDRFAFWRRKTGDKRIVGHAMTWSVA